MRLILEDSSNNKAGPLQRKRSAWRKAQETKNQDPNPQLTRLKTKIDGKFPNRKLIRVFPTYLASIAGLLSRLIHIPHSYS